MPPEETPSAGATPAAGGATPPQSEPAKPDAAQPPAAPPPAATAGDEPLGAAGQRALNEERTARKAAEKAAGTAAARVEELENASRTDQEKAVNDARKEGETSERAKWHDTIRALRVEGALRDAGCSDPAIASRGAEFATLKVKDDGSLEDLDKAVEAFKVAHPTLFPTGRPSGDFGNGQRGGTPAKPTTLAEAVEAHYSRG